MLIDNDYLYIFTLLLYICLALWTVFITKYWVKKEYLFDRIPYLKNNFVWIIISIFPYVMLYSFRYDVGTDYLNYLRIFNEYKTANSLVDCLRTQYITNEPIYKLLNYLSFDYCSLMFAIGSIICFFVCNGIKGFNNKRYLWLSLLIALLTILTNSTNTIRICISTAIVFGATKFLYDEKYLYFFIFICLASGFHRTGLIGLSFLLLKNYQAQTINKIRNYILYLLIICSPIFMKMFISILSYVPIASFYIQKYGGAIHKNPIMSFGIIKILPIILIAIILRRKLLHSDNRNILLFNLVMCKIPFIVLSQYINWAIRIGRYFEIFEIVLIPRLIMLCGKNNKKYLLAFLIFYYLFVFTFECVFKGNQEIIPYHTVLEGYFQ